MSQSYPLLITLPPLSGVAPSHVWIHARASQETRARSTDRISTECQLLPIEDQIQNDVISVPLRENGFHLEFERYLLGLALCARLRASRPNNSKAALEQGFCVRPRLSD